MDNTKTIEQLEEENAKLKQTIKTLIQYSRSVDYWLTRYQPMHMKTQKQTFKQLMDKVKLADNLLVSTGEESVFPDIIWSNRIGKGW